MPGRRSWVALPWLAIGGALVGVHLLLLKLSPAFQIATSPASRPVPWLVGLLVLAGLIYLALPGLIAKTPRSAALLGWILLAGLIMRLVLLPSTPMAELDYNRYLWDGAVVAAGINPYRYAPCEAQSAESSGERPKLAALARLGGPTLERINHPGVRSIYPPLTQLAFAAAHWLGPWDLLTWRICLLLAEALAVAMLYRILIGLDYSPLWLALYWWNPLAIKETVNSAHMDALLYPFLLGTLLAVIYRRRVATLLALSGAVAIKLWPILLAPVALRAANPTRRGFYLGLAILTGVVALVLTPMAMTGLDGHAGLTAYGTTWETNASLFRILQWVMAWVTDALAVTALDPGLSARLLVALMLATLSLGLAWRRIADAAVLCRLALVISAALLLLSPTQYPWYYLWLLPFLAIVPSVALLLLTALLPLYYLRFYFRVHGEPGLFAQWIVWLEFVPVWGLLIHQWLRPGLPSGSKPMAEPPPYAPR